MTMMWISNKSVPAWKVKRLRERQERREKAMQEFLSKLPAHQTNNTQDAARGRCAPPVDAKYLAL